MTLPDALAWAASILSVASVYLYGNKSTWGPVAGLTACVPWITLSVVESFYGMLLANLTFAVLHGRNLLKIWRPQ